MATVRSNLTLALSLACVVAACADDARPVIDAGDAAATDGPPADAADPDAGDDLPALGPLAFAIDPTLTPTEATLPPVAGDDSPRPVGVLAGPLGEQVELVTDELVVFTDDAPALAALLARWSGRELQATPLADVVGMPTMHLVRITPGAADPTTLAHDLTAVGAGRGQPVLGDHRVSSQAVLDLLAAATAEAGRGLDAMPNVLGRDESIATGVVIEADGVPSGVPRDACQWSYLAAGTTQDFAVCDAWRRLAAEELLPADAARVPVVVLDRGFDRLPDTPPGSRFWTDAAAPPATNPPHPPQAGQPSSPWHGTSVAATLAAVPDNRWGVAGTAGPVARVLHVDYGTVTEDAVFRNLATVLRTWRDGGFGPDPRIVNMSFGSYQPSAASALTLTAEDAFFTGLRTRGVLAFASAGNDGRDVDERARDRLTGRVFEPTRKVPCELAGVVCVGGLADRATTRDPSSNRGGASVDEGTVDIYGPYTVYAPNDYGDAAYLDAAGYYLPATSLAKPVTGTSFASPFVAGVAALLWAANPGLSADDVWATLRDTAHTGSPSPEVNRWIDASAAVDAVVAALRGGELCDGLDNDHDGATDEAPGGGPLTRFCYDGPAGTLGVGACHGGTSACAGGTWGACGGALTPRPDDDCDGVDDDCDGATDDVPAACVPAGATTAQMGVGICTWGQAACVGPGSFGACVGGQAPRAEVVPDGSDNDCDGDTDELDAPTGVTATTTLSDRVRVTWAPVASATSYEVFRQGPLPADPIVSVGVAPTTSFDDLTAPGYDAWSAIEVQNWIDFLRVVVSTVVDPAVAGADLRRRYTVRARQGAITSPSSAVAIGGRVAAAPLDVQIAIEAAGDPACTTDAQCAPTATCQASACRTIVTTAPAAATASTTTRPRRRRAWSPAPRPPPTAPTPRWSGCA